MQKCRRAEALGRIGRKADIFIHMKGTDAGKINALIRAQRRQKFRLGGRGGKDHVDFFFFLQQLPDSGGNIKNCSATRFLRKRDKINEKALGYDPLILLPNGSLRQLGINLRRVGAAVPEQPLDSG